MKEGRKPECAEKTFDDELQKIYTTCYSPKIQAPTKTRTRTPALVAGKESRRANHDSTCGPIERSACERIVLGVPWLLIIAATRTVCLRAIVRSALLRYK